MKCPVCSHVFSDTSGRCPKCGRPQVAQTARAEGSRLIEFPATRPSKPAVPDWRAELNEKVRAIRARRSMEALVHESATSRSVATEEVAAATVVEEPEAPRESAPPQHENPIVANALARVRRASEQAARGASLASAAHATLPSHAEPVVERRILAIPTVETEPVAREVALAEDVETEELDRASALFDPAELLEGLDDDLDLLDGIDEPDYDYTPQVAVEAPAASIVARAGAAIVDLLLVAIVTTPFVATASLVDAPLQSAPLLTLLGSIALLLAGFYLFSMESIAGRTVGMMITSIKIVDANGELPTPRQALVRVVGYFVSALSLGIGFVWAILHPAGSGWHDLLSKTRVIRA